MTEINSIQLPSGAEYNLTDGIHMPPEATNIDEMIENAQTAGDTGIAIFGLSASLTETICGTNATSICITKCLSAGTRVDFVCYLPSVLNSYLNFSHFVGNNFVLGTIDIPDDNDVTITYENTLNISDHIGNSVIMGSIDDFINMVTNRASVSSGVNSANQNRIACCLVSGNVASVLTGPYNIAINSICFAYTQASSEYIFYCLMSLYSDGANAVAPTFIWGKLNKTSKTASITYSSWYDRPAYFTNQTVNVGTATTIMTITSDKIFANSIVTSITFEHPEYITSDVTWTSANGSMTFTGTCTTATTANVIIQLAQGA